MSMQVEVHVPSSEGFFEHVKEYTFARQEVAVVVPGDAIPTRVIIEIYQPKGGQPEWKKQGRYQAPLKAKPGQYGKGLVLEVDFRNMKPIVAQPQRAAA